jgi:hypothetical protein
MNQHTPGALPKAFQEAIRRLRQHERLVSEVLPDIRRRLTEAEEKRCGGEQGVPG